MRSALRLRTGGLQTLGIALALILITGLATPAGAASIRFFPVSLRAAALGKGKPSPVPWAVPVYAQAPARAFLIQGEVAIVGRIRVINETTRWTAIRDMASLARERGADAIWLVEPEPAEYCRAVLVKWR